MVFLGIFFMLFSYSLYSLLYDIGIDRVVGICYVQMLKCKIPQFIEPSEVVFLGIVFYATRADKYDIIFHIFSCIESRGSCR